MKEKKVRIGIIGHFGGNKIFNDGQTVKTVSIYDALLRRGIAQVDKIDTYYIRNNPIKFCAIFLKGIFRDKKYIVLLSSNGRKVLFPVLSLLTKYLGKDIYHYAIGGRLSREIKENPKYKKYVSSFSGNWMESIELVEQLQVQGVKNASYIPNFKRLHILEEKELPLSYREPYGFCIFSRVMREKGVEDAIDAVGLINAQFGRKMVTLDIFGPAQEDYLRYLQQILEDNDACHYCGVVPACESVNTVKEYFALLFPTHWKHEGIPGTIIDALSAGVPIIARRWEYCDEMITDGYTGLVYEFDQPEQLKVKMLYAINHVEDMTQMKKNCLKKAKEYSEKNVITKIVKEMGLEVE